MWNGDEESIQEDLIEEKSKRKPAKKTGRKWIMNIQFSNRTEKQTVIADSISDAISQVKSGEITKAVLVR